MDKSFLHSIAILVGTTIGAGIFVLPLALQKLGLWGGISFLFLISLVVLIINLLLAEAILRTKENHQLSGYAEKYLGKYAKKIMALFIFIYLYSALTAYLTGVAASIFSLFPKTDYLLLAIIYFIFVSTLIYLGIKTISLTEYLFSSMMFLIFTFVFLFSFSSPLVLINSVFDLSVFFGSYGIVFFAFFGIFSIPEMAQVIDEKKKLKKAIIIAMFIIFILYVLFFVSAAKLCGPGLTDNSLICLKDTLPPRINNIVVILAILAMTTSYLILSQSLKHSYRYDFKFNKLNSFILTIIPSFVLFYLIYFLNIPNSFGRIVSITGSVTGSLISLMVLAIYIKSKQNSERNPELSLNLSSSVYLLLFLFLCLGLFSFLSIFY